MDTPDNLAARVFMEIVEDVRYVFPEVSLETAHRSAATFIQNPKMLLELRQMVDDKKSKEKELGE